MRLAVGNHDGPPSDLIAEINGYWSGPKRNQATMAALRAVFPFVCCYALAPVSTTNHEEPGNLRLKEGNFLRWALCS
jgi:hypothetical protein